MKAAIPYLITIQPHELLGDDWASFEVCDITMSASEEDDVRRRIATAILDPSPHGPMRRDRSRSKAGYDKIAQDRWHPPLGSVRLIVGGTEIGFTQRTIIMTCGHTKF